MNYLLMLRNFSSCIKLYIFVYMNGRSTLFGRGGSTFTSIIIDNTYDFLFLKLTLQIWTIIDTLRHIKLRQKVILNPLLN